jgi:dUTP pyrophosphatase
LSGTPDGRDRVRVQVAVLPHGEGLPLPRSATPGASGVDLQAAVETSVTIPPGGRAAIPTGIAVAIPEGWEWQIRPRSGLALRSGLTVLNSPGTVDSDYRGEVIVILVNLAVLPVTIGRGDRIAQAVLCRIYSPVFDEVDELPASGRGEGGFGSTGT